jgi:hypothetical protein
MTSLPLMILVPIIGVGLTLLYNYDGNDELLTVRLNTTYDYIIGKFICSSLENKDSPTNNKS